jgi:hypothetical protein
MVLGWVFPYQIGKQIYIYMFCGETKRGMGQLGGSLGTDSPQLDLLNAETRFQFVKPSFSISGI